MGWAALPVTLIAGLLLLSFPVLLTASWSGGAADDASPQSPDHPTPAAAQGRFMVDQELSKGMFLVADRKLRDPRFAEAVILLVDYNSRGAMGLIINRPTETKLSEVFPDIKGLGRKKDPIHIGGPVSMNNMFLLFRSVNPQEDARKVFGQVYVSSSIAQLERLAGAAGKSVTFRVYAGYSGWGAGQLEREIARGDWYVMAADERAIFDKAPSEVWPDLFRRGTTIQVRNQTTPLIVTRS